MKARDVEIMAPVGSYESLMAAIQGNANSVYFGIGHLNMRSKSSKNFGLEDLAKIASIAKENKLRTYITLNTVVYDDELEEARSIILSAKQHGISAIIASDHAVIQYAREVGMEIHMSTQTNITNLGAVKYWAQYADVMVLARELSLEQVGYITKAIEEQKITGPSGKLVQIEIFAHGALCMAVSGKCYLSLDNLNSSANRGACLQQCRRPYTVKDDDGIELLVDNEYIMSPKDLKTLDFLDKILKVGVRVLKIEGRGRSADYVRTVSQVYRQAVDAWFEGEFTAERRASWNNELAGVYNRGFWEGYYLGKKIGEWTEQYGSMATKQKVYVGKITNYYTKLKVAEIKMETQELAVGDDFRIIGPTTGVVDGKVDEIRVDLTNVNKAVKGDHCSVPVGSLVRRGDKVYKVIDKTDEF